MRLTSNPFAPAWVASLRARAFFEDAPAAPLFFADWSRAVFLHYEVDPHALQSAVPFDLDLYHGRAYVSFVAFSLDRLRFAAAPWNLGEWLLRPFSPCRFLNLRTYVEHRGEPGIYFLREWLSGPFSVPFGPITFGLPYRAGRLDFDHRPAEGRISGTITSRRERLAYSSSIDSAAEFAPCAAGSLDEFLLERYTAFTQWRGRRRLFHVWHEPWRQTPIDARVTDATLLAAAGLWSAEARCIGAHFSPGPRGVWMGYPKLLGQSSASFQILSPSKASSA